MRGRRAVVALLAAALVSPAACTHHGPDEGEAHLEVDGRARVERASRGSSAGVLLARVGGGTGPSPPRSSPCAVFALAWRFERGTASPGR